MAAQAKKRAWLVRTPDARVPPEQTDSLAKRLMEEQLDAIAYVGAHGEYWYDCVVDSIVAFKITHDVDFPVGPACWSVSAEDARELLRLFVSDDEIEIVDAC